MIRREKEEGEGLGGVPRGFKEVSESFQGDFRDVLEEFKGVSLRFRDFRSDFRAFLLEGAFK